MAIQIELCTITAFDPISFGSLVGPPVLGVVILGVSVLSVSILGVCATVPGVSVLRCHSINASSELHSSEELRESLV